MAASRSFGQAGMMSASPRLCRGAPLGPHVSRAPLTWLPGGGGDIAGRERISQGHREPGSTASLPLCPHPWTGSPIPVEGGGGETRTRTWVLCFYGSCSCSLRGGVRRCGFQSREVVNGGRESGTPGDSRKHSAEPQGWGTAVLPWDRPSREEIPGDSWLSGQAGRSPRPLASAGTSPPAPSLLPLGSDLLWSHLLIDHTP